MYKIHTLDLAFLGNAQTIASFLVESDDASLVLIETGPYSTFPKLTEAIAQKGFDWKDIKNVLLTHIHLDHAGAAWAFAEQGATIYLHPFGAKNMADPSKLMESARRIYQDQMDKLWGEMRSIPENLLQVVADREILTFGNLQFKSFHTPGHAYHHIAWQLEDVIFSGDVAGVCIQNGPVVAPLPPPDIQIELWQKSIDLLRSLQPKSLYLTHFGEVKEVEKQLSDLEKNIWKQALWVKEHWEANETMEEMTPKFDAFCVEELRKEGLKEVDIFKYQAANPAWMSVAGLVRYWKKKREQGEL